MSERSSPYWENSAPSLSTETLMTISTNPAALENTLDTQRDQAFFSLIQVHHLPPIVARVFSSLYRSSLGAHTHVRAFAERNGYDTAWVWWVGAVASYVGLLGTDLLLGLMERLVAGGKWAGLVAMFGIPAWQVMKRRGVRECVEFFWGSREEREEKKKERNGLEDGGSGE
ncbi:MAG: hypothetical protein Q9168_004513 [Polycauliona sp. 1 TL-2023]